jgi:hypothetical protein
MPEEGKTGLHSPIREYLERLDFGRKIHRKLNDGALLALCEDYGEDQEPENPAS